MNNIPINKPILLDGHDSNTLLQHEKHIKLMYQHSIIAFAGNVRLHDFMEARTRNNYSSILQALVVTKNGGSVAIESNMEEVVECMSELFNQNREYMKIFENLTDSQKALFIALIRPRKYVGDKIPIDGFGCDLITVALDFANNYEVIDHVNESDKESQMGFRASLFRDTRSNEYILGIAGTDAPSDLSETDWKDILTDASLTLMKLPKKQYDSMINFYFRVKQSQTFRKDTPLIVVGHSLGGYLAQLFGLTYPHIIKGLYTYQAPGAKKLWRGLSSLFESLNIKINEVDTDIKEHRKQAYSNLSKQNRQRAMNILQDKTFHIHTSGDSNAKNNQWIKGNFVQALGTKIPGYLYYINDKANNFHHPAFCVRALKKLYEAMLSINVKSQTTLGD